MKTMQLWTWVLMLCLATGLVPAKARDSKPANPGKPVAVTGVPSTPAPAQKNYARFIKLHRSYLARGKQGPIGVLFLGDSITEGWVNVGTKAVWNKHFGQYHPANFGIAGNHTQHVLWQIANGELDGIKPKVVVLMIGTNNCLNDPPEAIAAANAKIVTTIRKKLPKAKVLLLALFPRAHKGDTPARKMPEKIKAVNAELAKLDDGKSVRYLDLGDRLAPDGKVTTEIYRDGLHLTVKGYQIWAESMAPLLKEMTR
jgi:beta-glucosidase